MKIDVPKEIKVQKFQIALTPAGINNLVTAGHQTGIETLKQALCPHHADPVYQQGGIIHNCVATITSTYPITSTLALTQTILPHFKKPAQQCVNPVLDDNGLIRGLSTLKEVISSHAAAKFLGMMDRFKSLDEL
jgi:alanine dehydrogenase